MKYIKRIVLLLFLFLVWSSGEKAEAAGQTFEFKHYSGMITETLPDDMPYYFWSLNSSEYGGVYFDSFFEFRSIPKAKWWGSNRPYSINWNISSRTFASSISDLTWSVGNFGLTLRDSTSYYSNFDLYTEEGQLIYPANPYVPPYTGPTCTVSLKVNGVEYTITERYQHYFLSYSSDSVRLYFFDNPFTVDYYDLYTYVLYPGPQAVVGYIWDSENPDFLGSRFYSGLAESRLHPESFDYASNCDLYFGTGVLALPAKLLAPSYSGLIDLLPDEMKACTDYIIYRYLSPSASTNDYIFLGHTGEKLDYFLLMNWGSRVIPVLDHNRVRNNLVVGYFDSLKGQWVIESDSIGIGGSNDFVVPEVVFSTLSFYQQRYTGESDLRPGLSYYSPVLYNTPPDSGSDDGESDDSLGDEITGIKWVDNILFGIADLFSSLFVPRKSFLDKKINSLTSRFSFWQSMTATVNSFVTFLKNTDFTEPPVLMLDLSAANSTINYGLSACALDFTWYEPYKEDVDIILSAVLWLTFIWNSFRNLPNIINGTGGSFASAVVNADKSDRKGGK